MADWMSWAIPAAVGALGYAAGGGGGGQSDATTATTQSNLPPWLQPYATDLMRRGQALSYRPYTPYPGARIAEFDPLQEQVFGEASRLASKYGEFGSKEAERYMSPYESAVTNIAVREAQKQARRNMATGALKSAMSGGYGSSGSAIMDAAIARGLQQDVGDIVAKGRQTAYEQGLAQFGRDREEAYRRMEAMGGLGSLRQAQGQRAMDLAYQDFLRQRDYPKQMLQDFSGILHGLPAPTDTTTTSKEADPSLFSQLLGVAPTAWSMYKSGMFSGD